MSIRRSSAPATARQRGQMLVLFVLSLFVLTGITALVVDVSWYWANQLRVQRAADAAALAGVVWLPGDPTTAYSTARAEAAKNGYTDGVGSVTVTPSQDESNNRRLWVTVTDNVGTFFMKVFGLSSIPASRTAKAEYVLPVPMGSPENYYGVFGLARGLTSTTTGVVQDPTANTGFDRGTAVPATVWTNPLNADATQNTAYAISPTTPLADSAQRWSTFNLTSGASPQIPSGAVIEAVQVEVRDLLTGSGTFTTCTVGVDMSWDNGTSWSSPQSAAITTTKTTRVVGLATDTTAWGAHVWDRTDFDNTTYQLRLTWPKAVAGVCPSTRTASIDTLRVKVYYHTFSTQTVTTTLPDANLAGPGSEALNPRGFWATMLTEGAVNVNGDAYLPYYDTRTSALNVTSGSMLAHVGYDPTNYYNYAIEMPAGTSNGTVYIYDPVFCAVANNKGTGDRYFTTPSSLATGGVSSYYDLYDTLNTPYDLTDDSQVATSGTLFQKIWARDSTMGGSGGSGASECRYNTDSSYGDGRDWHDKWYPLASGLTGGPNGTVYRLHTTTTMASNTADQRNVDGENSFAVFASATGGTPRVYGLGAMQMYTPLSASGGTTYSEFYLAQIEAAHAGKTMEIKLWDAGDTSPLVASLQIEAPTSSGWAATTLDYTAAKGTTNSTAYNCNGRSGTGVSSITTFDGSTQFYQGCWLTIDIPIPSTYTAPQSGWWKIRYTMTGSGTSNDVTTWQVQMKGNPVHLIVP